MLERPLTVAWISFFPVEWLPDAPEALRLIPRRHPAPWQRILVDEFSSERGLNLHIFAVRSHYPRACTFTRGNATFHCVKLPRGMRTLTLFWWETLQIRRALGKLKPDLVQAWGTERGAAVVASRLPFPFLVTMQGLLEWYQEKVPLGHLSQLEARLERVSLRRASVVTAESNFAINWLKQHYPHLNLHQVEHAPNWLFHKVVRRPIVKPLQFLSVGTLGPLKGTDLLLQGLDKLRNELDFRLTLIGGEAPDYVAMLKSQTSPALWERVTMLTNLSQIQVAEQMAGATMLLAPTRVDNSPNSVKEAVVAGLPVVASAIGGIVDYVIPGANGLAFPASDLDAFIGAIREAASHPLFSRGLVEPVTLCKMREYLSPKTMAEGFLRAYEGVDRKTN
jgi:glycosyltransferase involved in cell wall biosynthesis